MKKTFESLTGATATTSDQPKNVGRVTGRGLPGEHGRVTALDEPQAT